ncbi:MAG: SPASM domain-containing protein, partial [Muribaculaceae bacterium]|nr:SPASM domain-containing protein [Muribaculaceae bacterium]
GVKGAEKNFFKVISLLIKRNYKVICYMSVTKESLVSLEKTVGVLADCGVGSLTVFPPFECGNWKNVSDNEKLSFEEVLEAYIEYIPKYIEAGFPIDLNLYRIAYFDAKKRKYKLIPKSAVSVNNFRNSPACRTFGTELNISPKGIISPCYAIMDSDFVKNNMPNILKNSLKSAITNSAFTRCVELKSADIFDENKKCGCCEYKLKCGGGCRSSALLSENNFFAPDPAMCRVFENGYYEKLQKAVSDGFKKMKFQ